MHDKYRKYMVYFFLYLAVICELLIIIVERDEAEEAFIRTEEALREQNAKLIVELLKLSPAPYVSGADQIKLGESKEFMFEIKGLTGDDKSYSPKITVRRDGVIVDSLSGDELEKDPTPLHGTDRYRFTYTPKSTGTYTLEAQAGTTRLRFVEGERSTMAVKLGDFEFPRDEVQEAIDMDPLLKGTDVETYVKRAELVEDRRTLEVISPGDKLAMEIENIVTAMGYPIEAPVYIAGVDPEKVIKIQASEGTAHPNGEGWVWEHTPTEEGEMRVTLNASDNRGAGELSKSEPFSFTVKVKEPVIDALPNLYINETSDFSIAVPGLEDVSLYSWEAVLPNGTRSGRGSMVLLTPEETGTVIVKAFYKGRPYKVMRDGELEYSEFSLNVLAPPTRIVESFQNGGEYALSQTFELKASICGKCSKKNMKAVDRNDIRVIAEIDGRDVLDGTDVMKTNGVTTVKFWLDPRARVSRDGDELFVRVSIGSEVREYIMVIYPN